MIDEVLFEHRVEGREIPGVVQPAIDLDHILEPAFGQGQNLLDIGHDLLGLGDDAAKVQPIFITIDPERDTPPALAKYVPLFDAGIIGLTGTPEQIAATSETFPIFFERVEEAAAPDGYTMGHTSHLFLFDPEAGFADSWPYGTSAKEILADLEERI